jgi:apolipoprotein N-acyltransferase
MVSAATLTMNLKEIKQNIFFIYTVLTLLGALQAYALASPVNGKTFAWVQVLSLAGFLISQENARSPKQRFWQSWVFATSWLMASVWWLYISIHHFGGLPTVLTLVVILLLCGALALYYALTISIYLHFKDEKNPWVSATLFASCWTVAELARAEFFTGFPWGAIGYAHIDSILVEWAPWVGVYGVGWIAGLMAALIAHGLSAVSKETTKPPIYIYAVAVISSMGILAIPWQVASKQSTSNFSVTLLQGNIPQDLKYTQRRAQAVQWYVDNALQAKTDLVVMPETAIPYLPQDVPDDAWGRLKRHFSSGKQAVIVGIPTHQEGSGYGNSAMGFAGNGENYIYHKQHLVPFGEFVPAYFQWFNALVNFGITDFIRGPIKPEPLVWKDQNLAIQICYEDLFGEELAKRFTLGKDKTPTALVNLSNIAWFGNTVVIPQHLNIARMRSIELNVPTVRATNSGGTAIIDASGRIQAFAKPYTQSVLEGQVHRSDGRVTWYAQWAGRWGLLPLWIFCMFVVVMSVGMNWRSRYAAQSH